MNLSLTTCQSQVITIGMQVNTTDWHIADTLTVTAHSTSNPALTDIATRTTKSPAPVLLVDDDRFISFAPQFQQMLAANNIPYDYWRVPKDWDGEFPPSPSEDRLQMYPVTVWYTGYDWFQPLVAEEENRLAAYLEHGGRLFFSSQDYLYNLPGTRPGSFGQYYLGTLKHTEDYSSTAITGQTDNLISNHFGPVKLIFPPVYQNNTDALTPTTAAQIMSIGQAKQINGLMNQGVGINQRRWRTAFTAFGPELLPIPDQARFMQRAVGWLSWLGTSRVTPQPHFAQNGETITYTAVLTNDGWAAVKQAYFTATIPTELTVDTYSPDLTLVGNELLWQGPLAQNERKELSYTATLSDPLPIGTLVDQTSWIYYDDHDILFERSADVYVNFPDLAGSTLGVTPALGVKPGEVLTYTLVIKNSGLGADPAVTATTTLPHMLGLAGVDPPAKGSLIIADRSITWTTDVAINEVATLTYRTVISYRPTTPIDAVIRIEDNITSPFELNARTLFEGSRLYMPLIGKN
jgi:uncharacterized repeat protein (TIGR01451 family)